MESVSESYDALDLCTFLSNAFILPLIPEAEPAPQTENHCFKDLPHQDLFIPTVSIERSFAPPEGLDLHYYLA